MLHKTPLNVSGFTLMELMLGLAIFFILAMVGVPSYVGYVRNSELSNSTTNLFSDMYYARSEAIKRKTSVSLCRSADAKNANPVCGGAANNWTTGWLVFIDMNNSGSYEAGTDNLLRVNRPPSGNIRIMANNNANNRVEFSTDGSLVTTFAPAVFAVCDDRDADGSYDEKHGRSIRVGPMGRPEITTGSIASCDNPA